MRDWSGSMCGIAGKIYSGSNVPTVQEVEVLIEPIAHRGPDDHGAEVIGRAGLGHRRLSIIDLSPAGHNPMTSVDGRYTIVFNGESYNYLANRTELEKAGYVFRSQTDTEVLLYLYAEHGPAMIEKISGMFSFAIWDREEELLFAARDRMGQKPFYYTVVDGQLIFGSELKVVLADRAVKKEIDPQSVYTFLHLQYLPAPATGFVGIKKLPAAHSLTWKNGEVAIERYWSYSYEPKHALSLPEASEEGLRMLRKSVQERMISDVPLGAHLSGGLDSSIVVALMAERSSQPVKTYSIGFDDKETNELPYAELVAKTLGTDHQSFVVKPQIVDLLPELARLYDEPYADAAALPYYYLSRETRKHVTVALNGDGGDENFSGYRRYLTYLQLKNPSAALRLAGVLGYPLRGFLGAKNSQRVRLLHEAAQARGAVSLYRVIKEQQFPSEVDAMLTAEFAAQIDSSGLDQQWQSWWDGVDAVGDTDKLTGLDILGYLADGLTKKVDLAAMAHSLEVRSPLLSHELIEWSARLPIEQKLAAGETKILAKEISRELLPAEIFERKKQPFIVPLDRWLREDLAEFVREVLSPKAKIFNYLERGSVERLVEDQLAGRRNMGGVIYSYLMLELWLQLHG